MLSPLEFSMSVHNAIIAQFSIFTGNKHAHSSLAGGVNSFEVGLIESIALLKEKGGLVGYLYYDYLVDHQFAEKFDENEFVCFSMILGEGEGELEIGYGKTNERKALNRFNISELLGFLKNDEKRYCISVGGGEILFERAVS